MVNKSIHIKRFNNSKYSALFDSNSGLFIRREFKDCEEPFWNIDTPELLDISITNYCEKGCDFCYRNSNIKGKHMDLKDYEKIIIQASQLGVLQVALGGGNPNQHPEFCDILKITRANNIVPSYTTNGQGITDFILEQTYSSCGAVAVSLYEPYDYSLEVVKRFSEAGIKINIHFLLNKQTLDNAIKLLMSPEKTKGINAIIFLNYKPVSELYSPLKQANNFSAFIQLINTGKFDYKIGFDSCSISLLLQEGLICNKNFIDFCEAGRFSAFISEDLMMYPCSFMVDTYEGASLQRYTLQEIWQNNDNFVSIREKIKNNRCKERCEFEKLCFGGCNIFKSINHIKCHK